MLGTEAFNKTRNEHGFQTYCGPENYGYDAIRIVSVQYCRSYWNAYLFIYACNLLFLTSNSTLFLSALKLRYVLSRYVLSVYNIDFLIYAPYLLFLTSNSTLFLFIAS
jgi:hypothetical protein